MACQLSDRSVGFPTSVAISRGYATHSLKKTRNTPRQHTSKSDKQTSNASLACLGLPSFHLFKSMFYFPLVFKRNQSLLNIFLIEIATRSDDASGAQGILRPFLFFHGSLACWRQMIECLNLPVYRHFLITKCWKCKGAKLTKHRKYQRCRECWECSRPKN